MTNPANREMPPASRFRGLRVHANGVSPASSLRFHRHLLTARVHLRLWAPSAPRGVAWGGAGPESSSGEQRKGKGRGFQATVPRELGRGPAPPASGRESGGCAHSFSVQSRERAEGAEKRGAPPREVRVPPPCYTLGKAYFGVCVQHPQN